jgi:L-2-hydroxycarboxylate dehydrogenase (NAD+)
MLKQFHLSENQAVRVKPDSLRDTVQSIFERLEVPKEQAWLGADVLTKTDLRGVESHGVSGQFRTYVREYRQGITNPKPQWRITRQTEATANIDSDRGLGIIIAPQAMEIAMEKAKKSGVGMVTMHNGRHMGMAAYHAMKALDHDMIGVAMTCAGPSVVPTFGAVPRLGTNPICLAAPAKTQQAFVYDGATSVIAGNKVGVARRLGTKLLPGWLAGPDGTPVMEEADPPDTNHPSLLPLGSTREGGSHKGYGLGAMVTVLTGILSGGGFDSFPGRPYYYHMVAAYRIDAFTDLEDFKKMMDDFMVTLRSTPPAPGHERVMIPGQVEWETMQERQAKGIPIHKDVTKWLKDLCGEMEVPFKLV